MLLVVAAKAPVILIVFHHLAPHNCKITTPTEKRISDRSLLDQCLAVVDAVFWYGDMYDCDANERAVREIVRLLRWRVSLVQIQALQQSLRRN